MAKTLYDEFGHSLPKSMSPEMVNNMPREIIENLAEEFAERYSTEEEPEQEVEVHTDDPIIDAGEKEPELEEALEEASSLMDFLQSEAKVVEETPKKKEALPPVKISVERKSPKKATSLADLNILSLNSMDAQKSINRYMGRRVFSTYMVVLPISGYSANMRGLKIDEVDSIRSSFEDDFELLERVKELTYACMETNSAGFKSYEEFLEGTSKTELEILLFGMMVKTFGHINEFNVHCRSCKKDNTLRLNMNEIIRIDNPEAITQINRIKEAEDGAAFQKQSTLYDVERVQLPESKIVLDIRIPSIGRESSTQRVFRNMDKNQTTRLFYLMNITDRFFLPHFNDDESEEPDGYIEITTPIDIMNYLNVLETEDRKVIDDTVDSMILQEVKFRVEKVPCKSCGAENDIRFDIIPNFFRSVLIEAT